MALLNLLTDVAGLRVGNADDARLKSGVTVVVCDRPAVGSAHVMGGAPGTRETELLQPDFLIEAVDAIVLSGGSAFGLDAASGDRKSTRLNSSHANISYAVFCLKKKKTDICNSYVPA